MCLAEANGDRFPDKAGPGRISKHPLHNSMVGLCLSFPTRLWSLKNRDYFYLGLYSTQQSHGSVNGYGKRSEENVMEKHIPSRQIMSCKGKSEKKHFLNFSCCIIGSTSVLSNSRRRLCSPCEYTPSWGNTT